MALSFQGDGEVDRVLADPRRFAGRDSVGSHVWDRAAGRANTVRVIISRGVRNQAQQSLRLTETNHKFDLTLIIDFLVHPDSIRVNRRDKSDHIRYHLYFRRFECCQTRLIDGVRKYDVPHKNQTRGRREWQVPSVEIAE
jgi:hypothetical protein